MSNHKKRGSATSDLTAVFTLGGAWLARAAFRALRRG